MNRANWENIAYLNSLMRVLNTMIYQTNNPLNGKLQNPSSASEQSFLHLWLVFFFWYSVELIFVFDWSTHRIQAIFPTYCSVEYLLGLSQRWICFWLHNTLFSCVSWLSLCKITLPFPSFDFKMAWFSKINQSQNKQILPKFIT